jgi:hypothetical protein
VNYWHRPLDAIPDEVWERSATLEMLVLADTGLVEVPPRIGALRALRMLDLGHNQLAALPDELGALAALEFLYVHDNRLARLPALDGLGALQYLNAGDNPLVDELRADACPALRELRVENCGLTAVPPLPDTLRELGLRGNRIARVALDRDLPALRVLDLRGNPLVEPPPVERLPQLAKLDLRWTALALDRAWVRTLEARGCSVYWDAWSLLPAR